MLIRIIAATSLLLLCHSAGSSESRILHKEIVVTASLADTWRSWTTEEGLKFISAKSRVELRIGGPYEWFLDPDKGSSGQDGAKNSYVLAFLPQRMIAFAWTFPPDVPELRAAGETTQVVVLFEPVNDRQVRVDLYAHGWKDGEAWQRGWDYFDGAWDIVLNAMKTHFEGQETAVSFTSS